MLKLALGVLIAGVVACGGGDSGPPQLLDGQPDGNTAECNPVAQSGCAANQKCSWIVDQAVPTQVGHIGCAPLDGNEKAIGAGCLNAGDPGGNPPGANGFDNCAMGAVCVRGLCEAICDPAALAGAAGTCDAALSDNHHSCGRYIGVFEVAGNNVAGACDSNCNIMDQTLFDGSAACGSPVADAPIRGCYANAFFKNADGTSGSCAPVRADDFVPTDPMDQQLVDNIKHLSRTDQVLPRFQNCKNCCAPGFVAEYVENDTSMNFVCVGLCVPTPLNTTTFAAKASREFGDDTANVKLPRKLAAAVGDGQCTLDKKGVSSGSQLGQAENCVYAWGLFLGTDGTVDPMLGPEGEQVGFCFPHSFYHFDGDGNGTEESSFPNFKNLPPRSNATPNDFPGTPAAPPDDPCDFVKSGFRATTCTRVEAGFPAALQGKSITPSIPQKQKLRLGGVNTEARNAAY